MDAHIIFGVNSVLNDNTCAPSIDALRTTHGDNNSSHKAFTDSVRVENLRHYLGNSDDNKRKMKQTTSYNMLTYLNYIGIFKKHTFIVEI